MLWALSDEQTASKIAACHQEDVAKVLLWAEANVVRTRLGAGVLPKLRLAVWLLRSSLTLTPMRTILICIRMCWYRTRRRGRMESGAPLILVRCSRITRLCRLVTMLFYKRSCLERWGCRLFLSHVKLARNCMGDRRSFSEADRGVLQVAGNVSSCIREAVCGVHGKTATSRTKRTLDALWAGRGFLTEVP